MTRSNGNVAESLKAIVIYGFSVGKRYSNVGLCGQTGTVEITNINEHTGFISIRIELNEKTTTDGMSPGSLAELLQI